MSSTTAAPSLRSSAPQTSRAVLAPRPKPGLEAALHTGSCEQVHARRRAPHLARRPRRPRLPQPLPDPARQRLRAGRGRARQRRRDARVVFRQAELAPPGERLLWPPEGGAEAERHGGGSAVPRRGGRRRRRCRRRLASGAVVLWLPLPPRRLQGGVPLRLPAVGRDAAGAAARREAEGARGARREAARPAGGAAEKERRGAAVEDKEETLGCVVRVDVLCQISHRGALGELEKKML
mmetsp:Transcript_36602/g.121218  ORF Transcript_36602/g.121218 Transcript_36602/m.121218 type:complete len:237 (-) Transcript_36602:10-720(-)